MVSMVTSALPFVGIVAVGVRSAARRSRCAPTPRCDAERLADCMAVTCSLESGKHHFLCGMFARGDVRVCPIPVREREDARGISGGRRLSGEQAAGPLSAHPINLAIPTLLRGSRPIREGLARSRAVGVFLTSCFKSDASPYAPPTRSCPWVFRAAAAPTPLP